MLSPAPKAVRRLRGAWIVPERRPLTIWARRGDGILHCVRRLKRAIAGTLGKRCVALWGGNPRGDIRLMISAEGPSHPQGYRLSIGEGGVEIHASSSAGIWNGVCTLVQVAAQTGERWPAIRIDDEPDVDVRGFMLDISRDKVPTGRELRRLIDWLSSIKINQLQLYFEHTFRYRRHRAVWQNASPMSAAEVRRLDRYCRKRNVELVPNQNSLGHMERWLKHARYAPLAEATGPWRSPFGDIRTTKATLCPTDPGSIALVKSLYGELLPQFSSRLFNVGCDEPFELGQGRSGTAVRKRGVGAVYLDYVLKLRRIVRAHGRRMMCWADMASSHPEILRRLPKDVILLEWGYEGDQDFENHCRQYARAGFEFYVCPGTSSWCSFSGRLSNALANMRNAARAAKSCGAAGYLITDWGDFGHRQYWPASVIPTLFGASVAWNSARPRERDAVAAAAVNGFDDSSEALAAGWGETGDLYLRSGVVLRNKTALFRVMQSRLDDRKALEGLTPAALRRMWMRVDVLRRSATMRSLEADELRATLRVVAHAIARALVMRAIEKGEDVRARAGRLATDMDAIIHEHRRLWHIRNWPGGYRDSESHYGILKREYDQWSRGVGGDFSRPGLRGGRSRGRAAGA